MIEFLPLKYYQGFYYYIIMFVVLISILNLYSNNFLDIKNLRKLHTLGFVLSIFIIIIMGLRPVTGFYFGDTETYSLIFNQFVEKPSMDIGDSDIVFYSLMKNCSRIININFFFLICSFLYVIPLYFASIKLFKNYWYYSFLMLVISLSFWSYGVNGVRNGIATSIFIYAISRPKIKIQLLFLLISFGFHKSMILPIIGYLFTLKFNSSRMYLIFWFFCIPFSLLIGSNFQGLISGFFEDDKLNSYFYSTTQLKQFTRTCFRWDFLIYSMLGVFSGWYFIVKKQFKDMLYNKIYCIYLFSNAIWIIVIRTSFSNRFAYLSWFIMGLLIVYPFLKKEIFPNQRKILANIIFAYFAITFVLDNILAR